MRLIFVFCILLALFSGTNCRWTEEQAQNWYQQFKWSAGFNYAPSYAVNQIQMWMSFNQTVIDRELKWAQQIGFSKLRVFLHVAPYLVSPDIFYSKIQKFLTIAKTYGHGVIFVLFDDCWRPNWGTGAQPDPIPGIHNSQWVQCPGDEKIDEQTLSEYVKGLLDYFRNNPTIVMWDVYNEVGNSGHKTASLPLLKKIFEWARSVNPTQPLTSGTWNLELDFEPINKFILAESDIITFHAYCDVLCTRESIASLEKHNRPIICTEYMARPLESRFITHLPVFKEKNVWAINWGFVFGRTQTYYPWWSKEGDPVPQTWFHDVITADGTPFDQKQTNFIHEITSQ